MNEIAEAAGISRPGLYLHFRSKEEVFKAAIVQFADGLIEEISKGIPSRQTIEGKIRYAFEVWIVQRFDLTLNSPEAKEISDSSYQFAQEALDQSYEKLEAVLASILKGHVSCRGNKKALSAEKMAHILTGAVRGFKLVAKSATELRKLIRDLVVIIAGGLGRLSPIFVYVVAILASLIVSIPWLKSKLVLPLPAGR